jgi:hypothetical protein
MAARAARVACVFRIGRLTDNSGTVQHETAPRQHLTRKRWPTGQSGTLANTVGTIARVRACQTKRTHTPRTAPTRTAPTRNNDARTAHPGKRAHRAPTRAPCAPLPETKRTRTRATTANWVSLASLATIVHNAARRIESRCAYAYMRIGRYADMPICAYGHMPICAYADMRLKAY